MKNKALYETVLSVNDLNDLSPNELLDYTRLLRTISSAPSGPYGIGVFDGSSLYTLNLHVFNLYAKYGKRLKGSEELLHRLTPAQTSTVKANLDTQKVPLQKQNIPMTPNQRAMYRQCYASLEAWLKTVSPLVRSVIIKRIAIVKKVDHTGEISILSFSFDEAYTSKTSFSNDQLMKLGAANILTWVSYVLYDTAVDEPQYEGGTIAAANTCLRQAQLLYHAVAPNSPIIERLFDEVDAAIAKEIELRKSFIAEGSKKNRLNITSHKKLLSSKSIAHCIGPLVIVEAIDQTVLPTVEKALRLYCAARQLSDDLHDWIDDLKALQPQYVIVRLFQEALSLGAVTKEDEWLSDSSLTILVQLFWSTILDQLLDEQYAMVRRSQNLLQSAGLNTHNSHFVSVTLEPIAASLKQAKKRNTFEKQFVQLLDKV